MNVLRWALVLGLVATGGGCGGRDPTEPYPSTGVTRKIDLTIEDVDWEVGPGAIYKGVAYNGQIPGPLIEANAGDHLTVKLTNHSAVPRSIHTHVIEFDAANDGTDPGLVEPGQSRTYEWNASYPGTYPYHDHGLEGEGVTRGLFGMVVVHSPDEAKAREHIVVLADFDPANYKSLPGVADPVTGEFPATGTYRGGHQYMHTINGKAYQDAVPAFVGKVGERERWRVVSFGPEFHTWHIHGHRWVDEDGKLTDNVELGPGMYRTFEFVEDNPGDWLAHCHVSSHMEGGMLATYSVSR